MDVKKLRLANQLRGKYLEFISPDDIISLAEKREIPHYVLTNPVTKETVFCFDPIEVDTWFCKFFMRKEAIIEQPISFINLENHKYNIAPSDDIPAPLGLVKGLQKIPISIFDTPPGIYFLCRDGKIVYIGQAKSVLPRVLTHKTSNKKEFDSIFYISCHVDQLCKYEKALIRMYKPEYNHHMTECEVDDNDRLILDTISTEKKTNY